MTYNFFNLIIMKKVMYVIVKHVRMNDNKKRIPVIILDGNNEIWEFETKDEAEVMREIFELNSDSGHKYEVKKI